MMMDDESVHDLQAASRLIEDAALIATEGEGADALTAIRDSLAGASALLDRVLTIDGDEGDDERAPFGLLDGGATDESD